MHSFDFRSALAGRWLLILSASLAFVVVSCSSSGQTTAADSTTTRPTEIAEPTEVAVVDLDENERTPAADSPSLAADPTSAAVSQRGAEQQPTSELIDVRDIDFLNGFRYELLGEYPDAVVVDGVATTGETGDPDYFWLGVGPVVYGDLDADGRDEAVVATRLNTGGSGVFGRLGVYGVRDGQAVELAEMGLGDRGDGGLFDVSVVDGVIQTWLFASTQGACCPDQVRQIDFVLAGDAVAEAEVRPALTYLETDRAGPDAELKFLAGTDAAMLRFWDWSGVDSFTFDAAAGQHIGLRVLDAAVAKTVTITHIETGAQRDLSVGEALTTWQLEATGLHRVEVDLGELTEPRNGMATSLQVRITDDALPAASSITWVAVARTELVDSEFDVRAAVAWPVLDADVVGAAFANAAIEDAAATELQWWLDDVTIHSEPQGDSEFDMSYEVFVVGERYVSVRFHSYDYVCCRPYPNLRQHSVVVDLVDERVLGLADIVDIAQPDALHALWVDAFVAQNDFGGDVIDSGVAADTLPFSSVILVADGIEVGTDRGTFGAAVPPTTTFLSASDLGEILKVDLAQ